ncbi:N-acetyllactosaminide beta-1,3-N-acetylglucosaminyltransferase 2 [Halichoeres trimaculatus]|uniref:N-acetyllactosaminide beta-1,3-N-acetylglucosaminyltransferase 2 n=1 Tax=Halichoeres trimaculatus TaxID=147232 RepID=UPI003D9ECF96
MRTFRVMIIFTVVLIFFYTTLHLEVTSSPKSAPEMLTELLDLPPQVQFQDRITVPQPKVLNVNVSDSFKQTITQNKAYWNRLLYSALKNQGKERSPPRSGSDWSSCKVTDQELLRTNVHDFNSYNPLLQDFVQSMNCRTPPVLINQPKKCFSAGEDKEDEKILLLGIKSTPAHFERRQAVRETWGQERVNKTGLRVRTVFLMGRPQVDDPDLSLLLSFEAGLFGDILQWDFHESFLNLTLKMSAFLQWTLTYCPHVTFVFSGDDDVFVNTPLLLTYLQSLGSSEASKLYSGHVIRQASPIRDPRSKYYIPMSYYDGPYPQYVGGGGFLVSGALLESFYSVSQIIPFYPIDDAYTGMCFNALGVIPQSHEGFYTFEIKEESRQSLCVHKGLILTHQHSPQQLKRLWRGIHSPFLTC